MGGKETGLEALMSSSSIIIYHHLSSSIIIYHHLSSSIIYHHLSSFIIIYHHLSSSIIISAKSLCNNAILNFYLFHLDYPLTISHRTGAGSNAAALIYFLL